MEDIPQPASESYSVGDRVEIYLDASDPDSQYHGVVCEVTEVVEDDLGVETGRSIDAYSYSLREAETEDKVPISFRHNDLVPVRDENSDP